MELFDRLKKSARILLKGGPKERRRGDIPAITSAEVAEIKEFFPREKFFIFGHARSGTTLLVRLARLHPEVHCNYQAHFFTRRPLLKSLVDTPEAEEWLRRKSNRWNQGRDLSPMILRAVADLIMEREAVKTGKMVVGDKSPSSTIHGQAVRDLYAIYPDAKLIYLVRDGRDVLISERFRNFVEDSKYLTAEDRRIIADMQKDQKPFTNGSRSIFTETFIKRVARGWVSNLSEIEGEGRRLFKKNYISIRYEDLLTDPFMEMTRLWNFLGVKKVNKTLKKDIRAEMASNPDEEWQEKRNVDLATFLPKGHAGNWQKLFTARDKELFKEAAGEMLVKWKYEKDLDW
jgi:LPS sulfotransferase NodH